MVNKIQSISCHQAELFYPAFFKVVWLTLAPINTWYTDQTSTWHLYIWKAANKSVFIKRFADRQIELKRWMLSQICLIHLFCFPYYHETRSYKQAISFYSWKLYSRLVCWVVLPNPTNIVLWTSPELVHKNM